MNPAILGSYNGPTHQSPSSRRSSNSNIMPSRSSSSGNGASFSKNQIPILLPSLDQHPPPPLSHQQHLHSHPLPYYNKNINNSSSSSSNSSSSSGSIGSIPPLRLSSNTHHSKASLASYKTTPLDSSATRNNRSKSLGTIELPPIRSLTMMQSNNYTLPPIRTELSYSGGGLLPEQQQQQPQPQPLDSQYYHQNSVSSSSANTTATDPAFNRNRHASVSSINSSIFSSETPSPVPSSGNNLLYKANTTNNAETYPSYNQDPLSYENSLHGVAPKSAASMPGNNAANYSSNCNTNDKNIYNKYNNYNSFNNGNVSPPPKDSFAAAATLVAAANHSAVKTQANYTGNSGYMDPMQNLKFTNENMIMDMAKQKKRRQRTGPSCDSCRVRKVKCDAEIVILKEHKEFSANNEVLKHFNPRDYNIPEKKLRQIYKENYLEFDMDFPRPFTSSTTALQVDCQFIKTPTKIIRFKGCTACKCKNVPCAFSKGFTRADILKSNRSRKHATKSGVSKETSGNTSAGRRNSSSMSTCSSTSAILSSGSSSSGSSNGGSDDEEMESTEDKMERLQINVPTRFRNVRNVRV